MTLFAFHEQVDASNALKYKPAATINDIQSVVVLFLHNKKRCCFRRQFRRQTKGVRVNQLAVLMSMKMQGYSITRVMHCTGMALHNDTNVEWRGERMGSFFKTSGKRVKEKNHTQVASVFSIGILFHGQMHTYCGRQQA